MLFRRTGLKRRSHFLRTYVPTDLRILKILLDKGAHVNLTDDEEESEAPLFRLLNREGCTLEAVRLLVEHGAKPDPVQLLFVSAEYPASMSGENADHIEDHSHKLQI